MRRLFSIGLLFLLLVPVAFGTERVFTRDSTGVTIRDRKNWEEHRIVTVLKGRDTLTTYRINVENFLSYGFYIRTDTIAQAGDSTLDLAVIYLQSDTTDFFARVDGHDIIDTSITADNEYRRWYPWYPAGFKYVKFQIYGNTANPKTEGDSIDVRIYLNKMWKGTLRSCPAGGVYANFPSIFNRDVHFYDDVFFHISGSSDYLRWNPLGKYLRPDSTASLISFGGSNRPIKNIYATRYFLHGGGDFQTALDNTITWSGTLRPKGDLYDDIGQAACRVNHLYSLHVVADTFPNTIISNNATASVSAQPNSYPFNVVGYATTGVYFERTSAKEGSGLPKDYRRVGGEFPDWRRDGLGTGLMGKIRFRGGGSNFFTVDVLGANKGDVIFYDRNAVKYVQWDASNRLFTFTSNQYAWIDARTASELRLFGNNELALQTDGSAGSHITFNAAQQFDETTEPSTPSANTAVFFLVDDGDGTQSLKVKFDDGTVVILAAN